MPDISEAMDRIQIGLEKYDKDDDDDDEDEEDEEEDEEEENEKYAFKADLDK